MITVQDIIQVIPDCIVYGNINGVVSHPQNFDPENQNPDVLMWVGVKLLNELPKLKCGIVICPFIEKALTNENCTYIQSEVPRRAFSSVLKQLFQKKQFFIISAKASIHQTVVYGNKVSIGDFVVIHENVRLGDNVVIGSNTVIHADTIIESDVSIGSNCTIGGVGFGYERDENGDYILIPHIGNVHLKNNVEIGNNTTIDRAVMGSTILEENVKVDNLVHIAHGVWIKRNSLIIANSMIGGSTIIGENVWVAPSSSLINKIILEDGVTVGMGAVVVKNVAKDTVVVGNPARPLSAK
jgi:UDP-3-O-[3-hydroxymyristoyl] glucosamine N-acyltransferase